MTKFGNSEFNFIEGKGRTLYNFLFAKFILKPDGFDRMRILHNHSPVMDKDDPKYCYFWPDIKHREKGESGRRRVKLGKAVKAMFDLTDDKIVEQVTLEWKQFLDKDSNMILEVGSDRESFKKAYTYPVCSENFQGYSHCIKSLSASCMRYGFENLPCHPAEVYASGDFDIVYVESQGQIAGRMIVYKKNKTCGPMYVSRAKAKEMLEAYMEENDLDFGDFLGAKLLKIRYCGDFVAPYIDDVDSRKVDEVGEYLKITEDGSYRCENTCGLTESNVICYCCEDVVDEGSFIQVDDRIYCDDDCAQRDGVNFCSYSEEYVREDVYCVITPFGEVFWCESVVNDMAIYVNDEYYDKDMVMEDVDGNYFVEDQLEDGEYFFCEYSEKYYPEEDFGVTVDGETISTRWIREQDSLFWVENENGEWMKREAA